LSAAGFLVFFPRLDCGHSAKEISKRRTFAIISHPDAGKTTLTEKLLLYGGAVQARRLRDGAQKSARARLPTGWNWKRSAASPSARRCCNSITTASASTCCDTPGHKDFSEDTYRVLTAVDSVVMVIDSAKGIEPQTRKLFEVCRQRGVPIFTFMNKCDRPMKNPAGADRRTGARAGHRRVPGELAHRQRPGISGRLRPADEDDAHVRARRSAASIARRSASAACTIRPCAAT
jgi:small GTP-binding protein